ncbi:GGDEF domain-containing protein [Deferrisoma palaeochoriense]
MVRTLLVIGPERSWIPPSGTAVGGFTLTVSRADTLDRAPAGDWDVVAFRVDALEAPSPEDALGRLRERAPEATFLPVTPAPDPREALVYLKSGAYEYLEEPLAPEEFLRALAEALENREAFREILELNRTLEAQAEQLRREKEELERRNRELQAVSRLAQDLAASLEPQEVVDRLGARLGEVFGGRPVRIGLWGRAPGGLAVVDGTGPREVEDAPGPWTARVLRGEEVRERGEAGDLVVVPMRARDRVVGFLAAGGASPIPDHEVDLLRIFADTAAIALENARLYQAMRDLSVRDELTGLFNRRYFQERLQAEWNHATRHRIPLALLVIDIDHFKRLNDGNDHLTGDAALRKLAELLTRNTRGIDTVARYGGEEFVVILPQTSREGAHAAAEKLRKAVTRTRFPGEDAVPGGKLTVSIGGAWWPGGAESAEELLERADHALYEAKQGGRNRTRLWAPQTEGDSLASA